MANKKIKMRLQGHEKFALREGWINKALVILPDTSDAFTRKDAPDLFGIGSNMVKSLRYWMKVLGLTNDNGSELSDLGKLIAENDPYLENMFTWWILHSNIAKAKEDATTWYMYFNRCDAVDLEKSQVESILLREITKYANGQDFSKKSLGNDIDVLLNMYGKRKDNSDPEDKNISPFVELHLVKNIDGKYVKTHPDFKTFPETIVLYEIAKALDDKEGVSIEDLIDGENGLAKIYHLTPVMANELLDRLDAEGYIRVDRTAGLDMIYPVKLKDAITIIENYYEGC